MGTTVYTTAVGSVTDWTVSVVGMTYVTAAGSTYVTVFVTAATSVGTAEAATLVTSDTAGTEGNAGILGKLKPN